MRRLDAREASDQGIRDLAAAVCIEAATSYKKALRDGDKAEQGRCEAFFRSSWFQALSGIIDGEKAVEYLRETKEVIQYEYMGRF